MSRNVRVEAILMEFEGVVADTFHARRDALAETLAREGLVLSIVEYWDLCAGWPSAAALRALAQHRQLDLDDTAIDLLAMTADRAYTAHVGKGVILVDGARQALERLSARVRLAVVSRLRRTDLEVLLSLGRLDHVFSFVIGAEDSAPGKPDPRPYRLAIQRLGRLRRDSAGALPVVALEDGIAGIRSAHGAGLKCIAVGQLPPHVAIEGDAWLESITGLDIRAIDTLLSEHGENRP
jgi:beta-phosphoglucomutase-like phosphatase (HAD superfamily)